jgi:hypothetical protein
MFVGRILAGGLLIAFGRKLFWLYVALLGFATGLSMSARLFHVQPEWQQLVIGIVFGIVGALLAYFFQEIAVAVAGFLGGAYVASSLLAVFVNNPAQNGDLLAWGLFLVGGIIGAMLAIMLFDWALIILTSLAGALLVMEGLNLPMPAGWLIAFVLFAIGIILQAGISGLPRQEDTTTRSSSHGEL